MRQLLWTDRFQWGDPFFSRRYLSSAAIEGPQRPRAPSVPNLSTTGRATKGGDLPPPKTDPVWVELEDPRYGRAYFYNKGLVCVCAWVALSTAQQVTLESSWVRPAAMVEEERAIRRSNPAIQAVMALLKPLGLHLGLYATLREARLTVALASVPEWVSDRVGLLRVCSFQPSVGSRASRVYFSHSDGENKGVGRVTAGSAAERAGKQDHA